MNQHNDYNKDNFWTSFDEVKSKLRYYIKLNNIMIEVEKDVYHIMFNSYRKNLRMNKQNSDYKLLSLDAEQNGQNLYSFLSTDIDVESEVHNFIVAENIQNAISCLDDIDKRIIVGIFYENKTEVVIGNALGITKQAVQKRKQKIFKRLRVLIDEIMQDIED